MLADSCLSVGKISLNQPDREQGNLLNQARIPQCYAFDNGSMRFLCPILYML